MRKIITPIAVILITLSATSCQRTYTCVCNGGISGGTSYKEVKASSTANASKKCEKNNPAPFTTDGLYCEFQN